MGRVFLDTNIFVYADAVNSPKRDKAHHVILSVFTGATGVISTQVLQEYYVIATRKLGVDKAVAKRKAELMAKLEVISIRPDLIFGAIDLQRLSDLSFWDALIIKAASLAGCTKLLSEDLNHGQVVDSVQIENPFI